jgi:hypothetical protein
MDVVSLLARRRATLNGGFRHPRSAGIQTPTVGEHGGLKATPAARCLDELQRVVRDYVDAITTWLRVAKSMLNFRETLQVEDWPACVFADSEHRQASWVVSVGLARVSRHGQR